MVDDGASRQLDDLEGADDPHGVMVRDPLCRLRVPLPQFLVKMGYPPPFPLLLERLPQWFIRSGSIDQPSEEDPDIESAPPDDKDRFSLRLQTGDYPAGQGAIP